MGKAVKTIVGTAITFAAAAVGGPAGFLIAQKLVTAAGLRSLDPMSILERALRPNIKPEQTEAALKQAVPPRVSAYGIRRLWGAYVLFETASNGTAVDVFAVHHGLVDSVVKRYLGDDTVMLSGNTVQEGDDGRFKGGVVGFYETLGANPGTAFTSVIALLPGIWTTNHRGDGVMMLATTWKPVKAKDFQETYPGGGPVPASIAAQWQRVYDWRAGGQSVSNPSTWTWSANPVLHLAHYKLVREGEQPQLPISDAGYAAELAAILTAKWDRLFAPTVDYWTAAANDCDTTVALKAGGTEARYRGCVSHKHVDPHKDVTKAILDCFDGWMSPRPDGALVIYSGRYYEPTVAIGPSEITAYSWDYGIDDEDAIDEIAVTYISAEHEYNTVETDSWIINPGERRQTLENAVPSHSQARRLAKRYAYRAMPASRGTVTTNTAGRVARGERFIDLHIEEAGAVFYSGPAEIIQLTRNITTGGVTFAWIAIGPEIDDWNAATEEGDPAVLGDRVPQVGLSVPVITAATFFGQDVTSTGAQGARIRITISGPDRDDLTWFARWRTSGSATWGGDLEFSDVDPGASIVIETDFVPSAEDVEVQVAYQVGDGRHSDWSATALVSTGSVTFDSTETTFDSTFLTMDRG